MIDWTTVILIAVAVVSLLLLAIAFMYSRERDTVEDRLGSLSATGSASVRSGTATGSASASTRQRSKYKKEDAKKTFKDRIVQAGLYKKRALLILRLIQFLLAGIPILLGFAFSVYSQFSAPISLMIGAAVGITGVIVPGFWLDYRKKRRQTAIRRALPDALDVVVVCVEAGLSLTASVSRVSKDLADAHPLLAGEMKIVYREVQIGSSTGEAMYRFASRFDLEELRGLAMVIAQTEKYGASVVNALRVHSDSLRTKRRQDAQERAQKAGVKLLFPTVFCIFPALLVVILGPAVFDILKMLDQIQ